LHVRAPQGHWLTCFIEHGRRHAEDQIVRETRQMAHNRRGELGKKGKQLQPDPHAQKSQIRVRWVIRPRYPMASEVRDDVRLAGADHWPEETLVFHRKDGEASRGRAAQESDQDCFSAIVSMVSRCDPSRRGVVGRLPEGRASGVPGPRLQIPPGADVQMAAPEGHSEAPGECLGDVELAARFGTKPMVDAVRDE
jgi:hypothetical protein